MWPMEPRCIFYDFMSAASQRSACLNKCGWEGDGEASLFPKLKVNKGLSLVICTNKGLLHWPGGGEAD